MKKVDNLQILRKFSFKNFSASVASITTPIGCFISGSISDKFGRKNVLHVVNLVTFIGWITIGIAYSAIKMQYVLLIIGRLLTGLSTGLSSASPSVYITEISTTKLRAAFTTSSGVFFSIGIVLIYVFGWILKEDWGTAAYLSAILPAISLIMLTIYLPESPVWLVSKKREDEAKKNMRKIYGKNCENIIANDFDLLIKSREVNDRKIIVQGSMQKVSNPKNSFLSRKLKYLKRPTFWKPFLILLGYFFFQQISGSFVVIFYAIDIVKEAGVNIDAYLAIVLIAIARLISAILITFISKKYGRRPLSILSGAGMTISMILLAIYLLLLKKDFIKAEDVSKFSWIPLLLLILYFFTSMLGFLSMPFAMVAEVYPAKIRGFASGLSVCSGYTFSFIVVKTYPAMAAVLENYVIFSMYGIISFIGTIFVFIFLPETRGKTLQEIEEYFGGKTKTIQESKVNAIN